MSQNLPNMLQDTISKIREMVDVNNVIGEPITVGRLLAAVFKFAFRALIQFLKIMKKRKGGAVNEPKSS